MENIQRIKLSSKYKKSFRKLHPEIQRKALNKIEIFRTDPFDPRLETHSLSGKLKDCWAFSVDQKYRIKFIFLLNEEVLFLDIGTHNIYK